MADKLFETISWEQAQTHNRIAEVGQAYHEQLQEMISYFTQNTMAQLTHVDICMHMWDLAAHYADNDYSKFLFEETDKLFDAFQSTKPDMERASEAFTKAIQLKREIESQL